MSIIETAIQKTQRSIGKPRADYSTSTRTDSHDDGEVAAVSRERLRQTRIVVEADAGTEILPVKQATLDAETMERQRVLLQITDQAAQRAYKILRTRMLQRLQVNRWHSIAVTGIEAAEGKTLTAVNLAIALAQDPHTSVVLVDLDLMRPDVATRFGMSFDVGLGDYLMNEAEIEDILYSTGVDRLSIIPNRRPLAGSSELLASKRMVDLLRYLENEGTQRILIFDMPPLLMSDDVLTFAPFVDGLLLVVSEGHTRRGAVDKASDVLSEMNIIGVVLNKSSEHVDTSYY
jgi:capsular exopolysaccharide synthesis family protein